MINPLLSIKNLSVAFAKKELLTDISMVITPGSTTVIMGPNGSGKSSLALSIMGHPNYTITQGVINFNNKQIHKLSAEERANFGIFLSLQNPLEIDGVTFKQFMRQALAAQQEKQGEQPTLQDFMKRFNDALALVGLDQSFGSRAINVGFSGGEKKKAEIAQMAILRPKLAILDEIDSGLDVDALKTVCNAINQIKKQQPEMAIIIITHYARMLNYIHPDTIHVLQHGSIVRSGGMEVVHDIEAVGYKN